VPYLDWLALHGFPQSQIAEQINEGEGDFLLAGEVILAGSGFRSAPQAHQEVRDFFDREVVGLTLVDPRYYHLDTALAVLSDDEIMYHPPAFSPESRAVLAERYPEAILVDERDAAVFGLNAVSDGLHVVIAEQTTRLPGQLRERGFAPIGVDTSELLKGGGGAKCCVLELRDAG
jgi:N-dimethylarginine dimethylaminohydrolase